VTRINLVREPRTYRPNLSGPQSITVGPDANLWVVESGGKIARVQPPPQLPSFSAYTTDGRPHGVATGPDGKIWFTQIAPLRIGRIESDGSIVLFPLPDGYRYVGDIIAGPDGNLWFTARKDGSRTWLWRITPAGVMTEFTIPSDSYIFGLASGPDGNIWFTEYLTHKIGRITPAGVVTEFPTPSNPSSPQGIVAGPDGNLWFTELGRIGRINPAGFRFSPHHLPTFTITEFQVPKPEPRKIAVGRDGNLWFTDESTGSVGIVNTEGQYLGSVSLNYPINSWVNIASAQDGRVWFGNYNGLFGSISVSGSASFFQPEFGGFGMPALATGPEGTLLIATHEQRRVIVLNVAIVSPVADGYVSQGQPTSTFGFANELQSKRAAINDPDGHRAAFVLFDLSRFGSVGRAKLRLFGQLQAPLSSNATIDTAILPLTNMTWKEQSLTWRNMPLGTLAATPLSTINVSSTARQWYEIDITEFVRAEKAAGRNVIGIVLRNVSEGPSGAYTSFDSREAGGTAPQLIVEGS
jgi:streptogramin lyase